MRLREAEQCALVVVAFAADTSTPLKTDDNTLRYAAYGSFAVGDASEMFTVSRPERGSVTM